MIPPDSTPPPARSSGSEGDAISTKTRLVHALSNGNESDAEAFKRLAALSLVEYDRCRREEAEKLGLRAATLDHEVERLRPRSASSEAVGGSGLNFIEVEAWPEQVQVDALLAELCATLRRFVIIPESAVVACAIFILHTWIFHVVEISPILFITGPTKRCGKSKLLSLIGRLVRRPLSASSATPAAIYRIIEEHAPTLLMDEVDAFMRGDERMRGLINSGHTRDAAFHLGCVSSGDDFEPRRWSTWSPKVFAGIGSLADTIEDRSIRISMRRRRKGESVERLSYTLSFPELHQKCARWAQDDAEKVRLVKVQPPEGLNDRAFDNWTVLLSIAELAGGEWPERARQAALELSGGESAEALCTGTQLLADIRDIFHQWRADRMPSQELAEELAKIEGRPWAEYGNYHRAITPNQLAGLLKEFDIEPRTIRMPGDKTPKGYLLESFTEAFERYLPPHPVLSRHTATEAVNIGPNAILAAATQVECGGSEKAVSTNKDGPCGGVAAETAP